MNAAQTKLLAEADRMSESTLVRMEDWELAYLRVAMLHQLEETLNTALRYGNDDDRTFTDSPARKDGVANNDDHALKHAAEPHASAWSYGKKRDTHIDRSSVELVEAAR